MTDAVEALRIAFMGLQYTGNGRISGILWDLVGFISEGRVSAVLCFIFALIFFRTMPNVDEAWICAQLLIIMSSKALLYEYRVSSIEYR